jgi:molybdate transport system regulatory protein
MEPAKTDASRTLTIHANLWAEISDQVVLSRWRVQLLEAIEATGSIRAAATQMKITYDLAWHRIDEMETAIGATLVERHRGGAKGGSAQLTVLGHDLVTRFNSFLAETDVLIERRFKETFGEGDWRELGDLRAPE